MSCAEEIDVHLPLQQGGRDKPTACVLKRKDSLWTHESA